MKVFVSNMKKYRKLHKISQEKLAEKISTVPNYIAQIEVGKRFSSVSMLELIAMALNIDSPELFTTGPVTFINNKSLERMHQEIMLEFKQFESNYKQFEKSISEKIKQFQ